MEERTEGPLSHPVRAAICAYVGSHPGAGLSEVGRAVGIGWGALLHHVEVLERGRHLTEVKEGRHRRLFPEDATRADERKRQAVAAAVASAAIIAILRQSPDLDQAALEERLGCSRRTIRKHLTRLIESGIVESRRAARRILYRASWVP